jgi:hypothetical protein
VFVDSSASGWLEKSRMPKRGHTPLTSVAPRSGLVLLINFLEREAQPYQLANWVMSPMVAQKISRCAQQRKDDDERITQARKANEEAFVNSHSADESTINHGGRKKERKEKLWSAATKK